MSFPTSLTGHTEDQYTLFGHSVICPVLLSKRILRQWSENRPVLKRIFSRVVKYYGLTLSVDVQSFKFYIRSNEEEWSRSSQTYWPKIISKYDKRMDENAYGAGLYSVVLILTHTDQAGHAQTGINHTTLPLSLGQVTSIFLHPTFLFLHLPFIILLFSVCTKSIHITNHSQTERTNVLV